MAQNVLHILRDFRNITFGGHLIFNESLICLVELGDLLLALQLVLQHALVPSILPRLIYKPGLHGAHRFLLAFDLEIKALLLFFLHFWAVLGDAIVRAILIGQNVMGIFHHALSLCVQSE